MSTKNEKERESERQPSSSGDSCSSRVSSSFRCVFNHLSLGKGKRPEGTEKLGLKAIRIAPEKERAILTEIRQLIDQGKTDAAEERVLTLLSRSPSSEGHYLAGTIYFKPRKR